jgi:hypothetical protein
VAKAADWVLGYFGAVWQIIARPSEFFRSLSTTGGIARPIAFALVTHWLGSSFSYLWRSLLNPDWRSGTEGWIGQILTPAGSVYDVDSPGRHAQWANLQSHLRDWFWGASSVIADPFTTLISIVFVSFFVFLGARILVTPAVTKPGEAPRPINYESAVRIVAYGLTPAILSVIPFAGGIISTLAVLLVTVTGAREIYRISWSRAFVVATFPKILFFGTIIVGVGLFIFAFLGLAASMFFS